MCCPDRQLRHFKCSTNSSNCGFGSNSKHRRCTCYGIVELDDEINSLELHDKLAELGGELLYVDLMDFIRGNLAGVPQDESQVTYAKKIDKAESELHFNLPAKNLHNKIRAFAWGPGTYTSFEGKRLKIHKTRVIDESSKGTTSGP